MTNLLNASIEELQAYEAKLKLINRINLHCRLSELLVDPVANMKDIVTVSNILFDMEDQRHADAKSQYRERELALAEERVEVQRESLAVARMKLDVKKAAPVGAKEPGAKQPSNIIVTPHFVEKEIKSMNEPREGVANHQSRTGA